jgi:hypothetical protein
LYHEAVQREIEQGEFKAVTIAGLDLERQSYIVYLKEKPLSILALQFLALLRASASQESPAKTETSQIAAGRQKRPTRDSILPSRLRN